MSQRENVSLLYINMNILPHMAFFHRVTGHISQWSCRPAYHLPLNLIMASVHCSSLDRQQTDKKWRDLFKNLNTIQVIYLEKVVERLCDGLRAKLNVNISLQVWFIIAADLRRKRSVKQNSIFSGNNVYVYIKHSYMYTWQRNLSWEIWVSNFLLWLQKPGFNIHENKMT